MRLLTAMDDGAEADSVGLSDKSLSGRELLTADSLVRRRLATFHVGRFLTFYYRLTQQGREVLQQFQSASRMRRRP